MAAATLVEGAPAGRTSASPAPNSALKSGSMARVTGSSVEETEKLLNKLREYVESKGGVPSAAALAVRKRRSVVHPAACASCLQLRLSSCPEAASHIEDRIFDNNADAHLHRHPLVQAGIGRRAGM